VNRPHFRRRGRAWRSRPVDPNPEYSRLDRLDGLHTRLTNVQILGRDRYAQCDETCTADCGACKGRRFGPYALPLPTRYDAEWPDVIAAEAPGGDLAAMAAPADWPEFSGWGEGYEIEPETRIVIHHQAAHAHAVAIGDAIAEVVAAMRTAETDLRADGRAYETGRRSRTEAAAMRHARAALDDRTRGARDAAWILAGHVGAGVGA